MKKKLTLVTILICIGRSAVPVLHRNNGAASSRAVSNSRLMTSFLNGGIQSKLIPSFDNRVGGLNTHITLAFGSVQFI